MAALSIVTFCGSAGLHGAIGIVLFSFVLPLSCFLTPRRQTQGRLRRQTVMTILIFLLLAGSAFAGLKTDIEFAKAGDVSLTLDASIPDGPGPFPTVIIVHG